MKKGIIYLFILLVMFVNVPTYSAEEENRENILIIHSYNQGFSWTDAFHFGITEGLSKDNLNIYTEYLDAYRQSSLDTKKVDIIKDYDEMKLLCIVVTDNAAFDLVMSLKKDYFKDVPVIFGGINGYVTKDIKEPNVTGILQNTSFDTYFQWMKKEMPHITNFIVCGADTSTTHGIYKQVVESLEMIHSDLKPVLVIEGTYDEQLQKIRLYDKKSTVLYVAGSFGVLNHDQYTDMLASNTDLPTFCGVSTSIVNNVIGGFVVNPTEHGQIIQSYIERLISGITVKELPIIEEPKEQIIFNYTGLAHQNMLMTVLPDSAIIINEPNTAITVTAKELFLMIAIILILFIATLALLIVVAMRKKANVALQEVNKELVGNKMELEAYSEELIASQEELMNQYNLVLESTEKIQHLVDYDSLTGLYNVDKFFKIMEDKCKDSPQYTVMYLYISNLDALTFTHGQKVYESLISDVGHFIKSICSPKDYVGITNNNHIILACEGDFSNNQKTLVQIEHYFSTPLYSDLYTLMLDFKMGIASYPDQGETLAEVVAYASLAINPILHESLYDISIYEEKIQANFIHETNVKNQIEIGLMEDQFILYFQPKYSIDGESLSGLEALIRWNFPDGTMKSPAYFIDIAEQTGQIVKIGNWVIEEACKTMVQYDLVEKGIPVAINLSGHHFSNKEIISELMRITTKYQVPTRLLELEITETSLISNKEYGSAILQELRELGFMITLDDFGTGYASITYIKDFPIDRIKVDQFFTKKIDDPKYETLLKAIIQMAQEMNFEVTVEGVETIEQFDIIKKYNPQELQGYLFSRPIPIHHLFQLKNSHM